MEVETRLVNLKDYNAKSSLGIEIPRYIIHSRIFFDSVAGGYSLRSYLGTSQHWPILSMAFINPKFKCNTSSTVRVAP